MNRYRLYPSHAYVAESDLGWFIRHLFNQRRGDRGGVYTGVWQIQLIGMGQSIRQGGE